MGGPKTVYTALTMKFTPSATADCASKTWAGGPKKFSAAAASLLMSVSKASDKDNVKYASIAKGLPASSCANVRGRACMPPGGEGFWRRGNLGVPRSRPLGREAPPFQRLPR
jgi:hypothetical protein